MNLVQPTSFEVGLWNLTSAIVLTAIIIFLVPTCTDDGCSPGDSRCDGDVLEVCNSDNNWETSMDCSKLEDMWTGESSGDTCCWDGNSWECLPPEWCVEED